jgi:hypothetical protein
MEYSPNPVVTGDDGAFVKGGLKFVITDDLQVAPSSTSLVFSLFDKLGLEEQVKLQEKVVKLNSNKVCPYNFNVVSVSILWFTNISLLSEVIITSFQTCSFSSR